MYNYRRASCPPSTGWEEKLNTRLLVPSSYELQLPAFAARDKGPSVSIWPNLLLQTGKLRPLPGQWMRAGGEQVRESA